MLYIQKFFPIPREICRGLGECEHCGDFYVMTWVYYCEWCIYISVAFKWKQKLCSLVKSPLFMQPPRASISFITLFYISILGSFMNEDPSHILLTVYLLYLSSRMVIDYTFNVHRERSVKISSLHCSLNNSNGYKRCPAMRILPKYSWFRS